MARYIEADKLLREYQEKICFGVECKLCPFCDTEELTCMLDNWITEQPTADVRENVHGKWIERKGVLHPLETDGECSECGYVTGFYRFFNYCPNCGAKLHQDTTRITTSGADMNGEKL